LHAQARVTAQVGKRKKAPSFLKKEAKNFHSLLPGLRLSGPPPDYPSRRACVVSDPVFVRHTA
jgi:hypothetical protein